MDMLIRALWFAKSTAPFPEASKAIEEPLADPGEPVADIVMLTRAVRSEIPRSAASNTASTGVELVVLGALEEWPGEA
jgi:hypothetical protein